MAPSFFKKISAAVACTTAVRAATESYQLAEEYTVDNFFDKFDFFTSTYTSEDSWDDTHGYVQYRDQADAETLGLISTASGGIYIGPDTNSTYDAAGTGRDSVRITSKAMYNEGLMIAKFSHMPVQACGAWPAFWSYGSPWLTLGEIDYFEGWNLMEYNRMALHTNETIAGECSLTSTGIEGTVLTQDCNNDEDGTGCGVKDASGVWSSTTGATFAMEWTESAIKVWSWLPSAVPSDITAGTPDPSSGAWGNPTLYVEQANCDLSKSFGNQQLVFNIDFCGDTAGSPTFWNETCSAQVGDSCANYVANNPSAFAETYFMIEGIQYYQMGVSASASVTASAALVSPTATNAVAGLLSGAGSVLESTLGATSTSSQDAAVTEAVQPSHHTTSYIYGTSTSTDEFGSETTVVVVVDTTICPVTAAEASQSSMLASESSVVVAAQTTTPASQISPSLATVTSSATASRTPVTTITSYSTSTSLEFTTSTIFTTSSSTITSCAVSASASCSVGDVTTVVIAVSTTICPVTAAEGSASRRTSTIVASASSAFSIPASSGPATSSEDSPVGATASSSPSPSKAASEQSTTSTALATHKSSSLTAAAAAASGATHASSKASTTLLAQATTEVVSATETGGGLEVATGTPTSVSLGWMTEAATAAAASASTYSGGNGTASSSSATASQSDSCSGLDCIVVSSIGSKTGTIGASGLALVAFAGAVFLF